MALSISNLKRLCAIFLLCFLNACGAPKAPQTSYLKLSVATDPKTFNPIVSNDANSTLLSLFMFEGLIDKDPHSNEPRPLLATSWSHQGQGLIWTFQLRDDVFWSDGKAFSADDVLFTFEQLIYNPKIPNSAASILSVDGKPFLLKKLGEHQVQFTLPKAFAPFVSLLTQPILPKHVLEKPLAEGRFVNTWGIDALPEEIVGTGPFMLWRYEASEHLIYKANPLYWKKDKHGKPLPKLDGLIVSVIPEQNTAMLKFERGELDLLSVPGKDFKRLKSKESQGQLTVHELGPDWGTSFLALNLNQKAMHQYERQELYDLFVRKSFRQALSSAIDRTSIVQNLMFGKATPQYGPLSKANHQFYEQDIAQYAYNLDKARALFEQAGYRAQDGLNIELLISSQSELTRDMAQVLKDDLAKLGIELTLKQVQFNVLVEKLMHTHDWQAVLIGLSGGPEPHGGKNVWLSSGQFHFWNPAPQESLYDWEQRIDQIFTAAESELEQDKRKSLYAEWQKIVAEQLPLIYTVSPTRIYAASHKLRDLDPALYGGALHNLEYLDKVL